jgi:hypothetical protein
VRPPVQAFEFDNFLCQRPASNDQCRRLGHLRKRAVP